VSIVWWISFLGPPRTQKTKRVCYTLKILSIPYVDHRCLMTALINEPQPQGRQPIAPSISITGKCCNATEYLLSQHVGSRNPRKSWQQLLNSSIRDGRSFFPSSTSSPTWTAPAARSGLLLITSSNPFNINLRSLTEVSQKASEAKRRYTLSCTEYSGLGLHILCCTLLHLCLGSWISHKYISRQSGVALRRLRNF
jgi:hypothetical protein